MDSNIGIMPLVEALIFASEQPVGVERIAKILEVEKEDVALAVKELAEFYAGDKYRGIELAEIAEGFFFRTKTAFAPQIRKIVFGREAQLSKAVMETMSVVAYKQPVTRAEIEHIRGVDSSNAVKSLLEKKLIRILGKKDVPGRPHIYGTTKEFLKVFGLKDLTQLPNLREVKDMEQEPQMKLIEDDFHASQTSENNS